MLSRLIRAARSVLTSFWFWPVVFILGGWVLAGWIADISRAVPGEQGAALGDLEGAADLYAVPMLTMVAAASVTIVTFVFSTLMVVLQLASSQLSPRILRRTLREGRAQLVMAVMVGTFSFSLHALVLIYGERNDVVPAGLVLSAMFLALFDLFAFLYFIGFVADRVRAPAVILRLADETAASIDKLYRRSAAPADFSTAAPSGPVTEVRANRDGLVTGIDVAELVRWSRRRGALVELHVGHGDPVTRGVMVAKVHASRSPGLAATRGVLGALIIERERTVRDDPPYGFRLIVDIANRALSPSINDPTTAVQCLDALERLLVMLAERPEKPGHVFDSGGALRVVMPEMSWRAYLVLATQEIYLYGHTSPQVTQRLERLLRELGEVTDGERLAAVEELGSRIEVVPPIISLSDGEVAGADL